MSMILGLLLGTTLALPQEPAPLLAREQAQAVRDALFVEGLNETDLRVLPPNFVGPSLVKSIHRRAIDRLLELERDIKINLGLPLARLRSLLTNLGEPPLARRPTTEISLPDEVPPTLRSPMIRLIRAVLAAHEEVRLALEKLTADEKRVLIEGLPRLAVHPNLYKFEFAKLEPPTPGEVRSLLQKTDLVRIQHAAERLYAEAEATFAALDSATPPSFRSKLRFTVEGLPIVLAGLADDTHNERNAMITVDLGGNDRYSGRHGAGIGYASVFVDLSGDDSYDVPDISLGAGLLGIGLAWDLRGSEKVRGGSICLGAGIAGVGCFKASEGDFESVALSQGFGIQGVGVFASLTGSNLYRAKYLSQGSALDSGLGVMLDTAGRDTYLSTGLAPSLESDSILRSRSQGFGESGVGLLVTSSSGADLTGGTESQGCGLDGGLGLLIGSDASTFRMEGYGQGFGGSGGVGALLRGREFISRGVAQGVGVQSGIGLILGSPEGDLYASAGRPANGIDGGLGVLLDFGGSDRYVSSGRSIPTDVKHIGLGILVDLGGPNTIPAENSISSIQSSGLVGIVAEFEARAEADLPNSDAIPQGASLTAAAQIETAVKEAAGSAPYASRAMRLQARKSLELSMPAAAGWLEYLRRPLDNREAILLGALVSAANQEVQARVRRQCGFAIPTVAKNALRILAQGHVTSGKDEVLAGLGREELAVEAAHAARELAIPEAVPDLMVIAGSGTEPARRAAAVALSTIGGQDALATAQALLGSPDYVVRTAATALIGRHRPASIAPYKSLVTGSSEISARAAMRALGAIGSPEAIQFLGTTLGDRQPGIRIEALRALAGRCPREFRTEFNARREDPDLRVRHAALCLDPGG